MLHLALDTARNGRPQTRSDGFALLNAASAIGANPADHGDVTTAGLRSAWRAGRIVDHASWTAPTLDARAVARAGRAAAGLSPCAAALTADFSVADFSVAALETATCAFAAGVLARAARCSKPAGTGSDLAL